MTRQASPGQSLDAMKLSQALAVIACLPVSESQAVDIQTLCKRVRGVSVRTMQRYMEELSGVDSEYRPIPLVRRIEQPPVSGPGQGRGAGGAGAPPGRAYRYCLDTSALRQWFMTDHMALNLLLADQAVGASLGASSRLGASGLAAEAAQLIQRQGQEVRRISAYVRIVPDGMGRHAAQIDAHLVDTVIEAIAQGRQLSFAYASARGNARRWEVSPRGLVAKDGTLYLVATRGLSDAPTTFALHRVRGAQVMTQAVAFRDFDIDRFLVETQLLSHPFGPGALIDLELRVAPESLYHFQERPLWGQEIGPAEPSGHVRVTARVVDGVMLVPFLLSMGPWVEVLGPSSVRQEVARRVREMGRAYRAGRR